MPRPQNPFSADPYIRAAPRPFRSLPAAAQPGQAHRRALPRKQPDSARLRAGPIAVLKLLASQAAISLENTRLYRDLAEREAKIRRLVDANIIGIFIWDLDGRIIEANDAFLRMVGYDREDLVVGTLALDGPDAAGMARAPTNGWLPELKVTGICSRSRRSTSARTAAACRC